MPFPKSFFSGSSSSASESSDSPSLEAHDAPQPSHDLDFDDHDITMLPDESAPIADNDTIPATLAVLDSEPQPENMPIMPTIGGTLYVVSTPIGNRDDITLRAIYILKTADVVVCEEFKMGKRLLYEHRLDKHLEELNEHNSQEQTPAILRILKSGKSVALISDAGTPLLADPGMMLVRTAIGAGISVQAIPGASSILAGLVTSGFSLHEFVFAGFLPREPKDRIAKLQDYAREHRTIVLLETPYRLMPVLQALAQTMPERACYVGCNLTMPNETHHYGTAKQLSNKFLVSPFKGEFVICLGGRNEEARFHHTSQSKSDGERRDFKRDGERRDFKRDDERKDFKRDGERSGFKRDGERSGFKRDGERSGFKRDGERRDFKRDGERRDFKRDENTGDAPRTETPQE